MDGLNNDNPLLLGFQTYSQMCRLEIEHLHQIILLDKKLPYVVPNPHLSMKTVLPSITVTARGANGSKFPSSAAPSVIITSEPDSC